MHKNSLSELIRESINLLNDSDSQNAADISILSKELVNLRDQYFDTEVDEAVVTPVTPKNKPLKNKPELPPIPTTIQDAKKVYEIIKKIYDANLAGKGPKLPTFSDKSGIPNYGTLQLIYLFCNLKKSVNSMDVAAWARKYFIPSAGDAQIRHWGAQRGYNMYGGGDKDPAGNVVPGKKGSYSLWDLENVSPGFKGHRTNVVKGGDWEAIKEAYGYRCATCGSKEGEPNFKNPAKLTKLEKGHMNNEVGSDMSSGNIIPQCPECNKSYRDKVNFDEKGQVSSLSNAELVKASSPATKIKILKYLLSDKDILNTISTDKTLRTAMSKLK